MQTDLTVNEIQRNNEAIKNGNEAAKNYAETLSNAVKKGVDTATSAIKAQRTEVEKIDDNYKELGESIDKGIRAAYERLDVLEKKGNKISKKEKKEADQLRKDINTMLDGSVVLYQNFLNALSDYDKKIADSEAKDYLAELEKRAKLIEFSAYHLNGSIRERVTLMRDVLGYTEAEIRAYDQLGEANNKRFEELAALRDYILGGLKNSGITIDGETLFNEKTGKSISWKEVAKTAFSDPKRLQEYFGEPIATAIQSYINNDKDIKNTLNDRAKKVVEYYSEAVQKAINNGDLSGAMDELTGKLVDITTGKRVGGLEQELIKVYGGEDIPKELKNVIKSYIKKIQDNIKAQQIDNPLSDMFLGREGLISAFSAFYDNLKGQYEQIENLTDVQRRERFTKEMNAYYSFLDSYGSATADALSAVGDLWEKSLQLRYKQQVESGKMTAEEAEAQAEKSFKAVKALQIGVATVDTATAIMRALSDASVPSYYVRAANAVAAGIAGAANIATIAMTNFGAPSVNTSNFATPTYTEAPSEMIYTYAINTADMAEANAQNPIRAFIVDRDLAEGMRNYDNRQNETSF